jgi:hypothetical protein
MIYTSCIIILSCGKIKMEMQALSLTCQHLNTYASIELSQMRSEILDLELKILDLQMELCIFRALYKVWKAFALNKDSGIHL